MGYSIIFETKIVILPDGRIIHFDRSGCNNDNAGRKKGEFTGKIYSKDEFVKYAEHYKKKSKPYKEYDGWDLKIRSRCATYFDYGEHLLRMLKRAKSYGEFVNQYYFQARYCKAIQLIKPEEKEMTLEEFDKAYYDLLYNGGLSYYTIMEYPESMEEIVKCLEDNKPMEFYIDKYQK